MLLVVDGGSALGTLILCSRNEHKREELQAALPGWTIELLDADDYPPETGKTYLENARDKALYGHEVEPGEWMVGEDSGIEVVALGGRPGIHSARWAEDPVVALLAELDDATDRRARYVCELVAISPEGVEVNGRGTLEGDIAYEPRGSEGFGYDPIFLPAGENRTVAELGNEWKRANSHRARAAAALSDALAARRSRGGAGKGG
jgi:XTP/dITP diphosphohydrolase